MGQIFIPQNLSNFIEFNKTYSMSNKSFRLNLTSTLADVTVSNTINGDKSSLGFSDVEGNFLKVTDSVNNGSIIFQNLYSFQNNQLNLNFNSTSPAINTPLNFNQFITYFSPVSGITYKIPVYPV